MKEIDWSFSQIWNEAAKGEEREIKPRDYCYASEIGASHYERWNKMKGIAPLSPPNERARRKFNAGNLWEYVAMVTLKSAGLIRESQDKVDYSIDNLLSVHGRLDFLGGGIPDPSRAIKDIMAMDLPPFIQTAAKRMAETLCTGESLMEKVLEIKSISSMAYKGVELRGAYPTHKMQCFHYAYGLKKPGLIVYIEKDSCLMHEESINFQDELLYQMYRDDVEKMTEYFKYDVPPPKEPLIKFEGKFSKNLAVEYSAYLPHYGFETQSDYRAVVDKPVAGMNRVLKRAITGQKMTKKNEEMIVKAKEWGFDWDECLHLARAHQEILTENNDDDDDTED